MSISKINTRSIELSSGKLSWRENKEFGPSIIFLHGNSQSSLIFSELIENFPDNKYRLISMDLPGHGDSDFAKEPDTIYTLPGYASVINEFVNAADIEDVIYCGFDLGGHILTEAIPLLDRARGIMIYGSPPVSDTNQIVDAFLPEPTSAYLFEKNIDHEIAFRIAAVRFARPSPELIQRDAILLLRTDGNCRFSLGASLLRGEFSDHIELIKKSKIPVALLHGSKDRFVSKKYLESLPSSYFWKGKIQILSDCGHDLAADCPAGLTAKLLEFSDYCINKTN